MRTSLLGFAFLSVCLAPTNGGCGGVTALPASDDAGSGADGSSDSGTGKDSGGDDAGQGSDGGLDCPTMSVELEQLQKQASACCSKCNIVQCTVALPGVCCPISVTAASSQASKDYETLLHAFLQQCHPNCPAILCPTAPSGTCGPAGECE